VDIQHFRCPASGIESYRHGLLLRPSGGVVFRRSALSRLSRFTNSKIGRNGENQEVKVLPSEQDLRLVRIKQEMQLEAYQVPIFDQTGQGQELK
jgi:hypothetical protein